MMKAFTGLLLLLLHFYIAAQFSFPQRHSSHSLTYTYTGSVHKNWNIFHFIPMHSTFRCYFFYTIHDDVRVRRVENADCLLFKRHFLAHSSIHSFLSTTDNDSTNSQAQKRNCFQAIIIIILIVYSRCCCRVISMKLKNWMCIRLNLLFPAWMRIVRGENEKSDSINLIRFMSTHNSRISLNNCIIHSSCSRLFYTPHSLSHPSIFCEFCIF
jgi:hypothetical protein